MIAIKKKFQFKTERSNNKMFWASCLDNNCNWKMHARHLQKTRMFKVVKCEENHSCSLDFTPTDHRQATATLVVELIKDNLVDLESKIQISSSDASNDDIWSPYKL